MILSPNDKNPIASSQPSGSSDNTSPPPNFTPYEAEYFQVGYSDIVSHDSHLNSDGEALYRFILSQAASTPFHRISCRGIHTERRDRWVTERDSHGHSHSRLETYTDTIKDFDFCIDIIPNTPPNPVQWSVADDEPAYRGLMVRQFETSSGTGRHIAKGQILKRYKNWGVKRNRLGLPPWVRDVDIDITDGSSVHLDSWRSSKTLRQWADEYCASPKYLKEFVYKKVLYGWNIEQIQSAIRSTIKSSYYGSIQIDITPHHSKIYIRPNNAISRMLSNKWLKFLSIILLIFPFIWLFKRFHSRGGGRWEVCGGAYPLKQWVPLEPGEEIIDSDPLPPYNPFATSSSLPTSQTTQSSTRYIQTLTGPKKLLGLKEGEWFRSWEGAIVRAVVGRHQSPIPLQRNLPGNSLDGYNETLIQF